MQDDVAVGQTFDFEEHLLGKWGAPQLGQVYEPGAADLAAAAAAASNDNVCRYFLRGTCHRGSACPNRHVQRNDRAVVCKHWLRGLCKKGDQCEFLHEYKLTKMPECFFFAKHGACSNGDECKFLHIDPKSRVRECPWYQRGFCKLGPNCPYKHVRKVPCKLYLFGFCPDGPACKFEHLRFDLQLDSEHRPMPVNRAYPIANTRGMGRPGLPMDKITCFKCGQQGHMAAQCPNMPAGRPGAPVYNRPGTARPLSSSAQGSAPPPQQLTSIPTLGS